MHKNAIFVNYNKILCQHNYVNSVNQNRENTLNKYEYSRYGVASSTANTTYSFAGILSIFN